MKTFDVKSYELFEKMLPFYFRFLNKRDEKYVMSLIENPNIESLIRTYSILRLTSILMLMMSSFFILMLLSAHATLERMLTDIMLWFVSMQLLWLSDSQVRISKLIVKNRLKGPDAT